jgi:hypothetical protein
MQLRTPARALAAALLLAACGGDSTGNTNPDGTLKPGQYEGTYSGAISGNAKGTAYYRVYTTSRLVVEMGVGRIGDHAVLVRFDGHGWPEPGTYTLERFSVDAERSGMAFIYDASTGQEQVFYPEMQGTLTIDRVTAFQFGGSFQVASAPGSAAAPLQVTGRFTAVRNPDVPCTVPEHCQ